MQKSIEHLGEIVGAVSSEAELADQEIHKLFQQVREALDRREAEVLQEADKVRHQKDKELRIQKDAVEFVYEGSNYSTAFATTLLTEGTDTEIAASRNQVVARMGTLKTEFSALTLEPTSNASIEFKPRNLDSILSSINTLGEVVSRDAYYSYSTCRSSYPTGQIKKPYFFTVAMHDSSNIRIPGRVPFTITFSGPAVLPVRLLFSSHASHELSHEISPFFILIRPR